MLSLQSPSLESRVVSLQEQLESCHTSPARQKGQLEEVLESAYQSTEKEPRGVVRSLARERKGNEECGESSPSDHPATFFYFVGDNHDDYDDDGCEDFNIKQNAADTKLQ